MNIRTLEDLRNAVNAAIDVNDSAELVRCADELGFLSDAEAHALFSIARGAADRIRGNYPQALEHFHRAFSVYEDMADHNGVARAIVNIGIVYALTGNYSVALEHFHRALTMFEFLGESNSVANVVGNVGNVYQSTDNFPAALEHYKRALSMHEELGEPNGVAHITGNIGAVHHNTGNYPAALEHYHRAVSIHEELGHHSSVAFVNCGILKTLIRSGKHAKADDLLQKIDAMQIEEPVIVVSKETSRAELQQNVGNIEGAKKTLLTALETARKHSLATGLARIHKALRDLALNQKDLVSYIEHNNEYTRITEEINGKDTATKLAMQEKQREIDAREREHQKHLAVLHSTLPKHIADRVVRGETVNDHHDNASVIFVDIVGFTAMADQLPSEQVIRLLEKFFTELDIVSVNHKLTKIKTIGDSYMAVAFRG